MGVIEAIVESIPAYTGLSATTFFTIMGLVVAVYYLIAAMLAPPPVKYVPRDARPAPVQIGVVTAEELRQYDGSDPTKPLLMAIKSHIYDVSQSRFVSRLFSSLLTLNIFCLFCSLIISGVFLLWVQRFSWALAINCCTALGGRRISAKLNLLWPSFLVLLNEYLSTLWWRWGGFLPLFGGFGEWKWFSLKVRWFSLPFVSVFSQS